MIIKQIVLATFISSISIGLASAETENIFLKCNYNYTDGDSTLSSVESYKKIVIENNVISQWENYVRDKGRYEDICFEKRCDIEYKSRVMTSQYELINAAVITETISRITGSYTEIVNQYSGRKLMGIGQCVKDYDRTENRFKF